LVSVAVVFKSIPNYSLTLKIGRLLFIAFLALKKGTDAAVAPGFGRYPFTRDKRRPMPNVLVMTAFEFCSPITLVILFEAFDLSLHLH
jgi:hypothetical protein